MVALLWWPHISLAFFFFFRWKCLSKSSWFTSDIFLFSLCLEQTGERLSIRQCFVMLMNSCKEGDEIAQLGLWYPHLSFSMICMGEKNESPNSEISSSPITYMWPFSGSFFFDPKKPLDSTTIPSQEAISEKPKVFKFFLTGAHKGTSQNVTRVFLHNLILQKITHIFHFRSWETNINKTRKVKPLLAKGGFLDNWKLIISSEDIYLIVWKGQLLKM